MLDDYPYIDSIAYWIRWSQELILVLSVPLLTIGLVVGTFDFLSGGTLLHYTAIKYGWTALQALVLDACFAMYWVKAFMAKGWGVRIASGFLGLSLGVVAGGINFLQQVSELLHITALDSLLHLGFPPEFLLLLRALLSVILLAIGACSVARKERVIVSQISQESSVVQQETFEESEPERPVQELTVISLDGGAKREKIKAVLRENPDASLSEIEERAGVSQGYASKIRGKLLVEIQNEKHQLNGVH